MMDLFPMLVSMELQEARHKHGQLKSAHEAWAVIFEELQELQAEVFKKREQRSKESMLRELVQTAAMCQRMAEDLDLVTIGNTGDAMEAAFQADLRRLVYAGGKGGDA